VIFKKIMAGIFIVGCLSALHGMELNPGRENIVHDQAHRQDVLRRLENGQNQPPAREENEELTFNRVCLRECCKQNYKTIVISGTMSSLCGMTAIVIFLRICNFL